MFSCTWVLGLLGFYVFSDSTHKNLGIVDSLSYKIMGAITLFICLFFGCFNDVQHNDCNCFNLDKFKNWTKPPIFVYFPGVLKLVYGLDYVGILYIYIFNKAIHMRYMLLFRHICWCIRDQHPHICISLLFLFTEYMLW